jgi:hypothetical protein
MASNHVPSEDRTLIPERNNTIAVRGKCPGFMELLHGLLIYDSRLVLQQINEIHRQHRAA